MTGWTETLCRRCRRNDRRFRWWHPLGLRRAPTAWFAGADLTSKKKKVISTNKVRKRKGERENLAYRSRRKGIIRGRLGKYFPSTNFKNTLERRPDLGEKNRANSVSVRLSWGWRRTVTREKSRLSVWAGWEQRKKRQGDVGRRGGSAWADLGRAHAAGEERGKAGPTFGPKPKRRFKNLFYLNLFMECNSIY